MRASGLPENTLLGSYRIGGILGCGGMGVVYRGVEVATNRPVALKVVLPELASDPRFMARVALEAKAAASVVHPHIASLYFVGDLNGLPYLVFEFVPGGTLKARIDREGPLPWRRAARLGAQIARALEAIHAAGLIHRDLKPVNVLLDDEGNAKLSDFGLARESRREKGASLTKTGEVLGTPEFMAPEQADGTKSIDARADLYALGATLYALLAGRPPFEGVGFSLVKKVLLEKPAPPSKLVAEIPERFERLVMSLLEKDPAARPASAAGVAEELEAIADMPEPAGRRSRAMPMLVGAALAASAIGGGLFIAFRDSRLPAPVDTATAPRKPSPTPAKPPVEKPPSPSPTAKPARVSLQRIWAINDGVKICAVALTPDGLLALTGAGPLPGSTLPGEKSVLTLWDLTPTPPRSVRLRGHRNFVWHVAFSPDGKQALSGSPDDHTVKLWDVARAREGGEAIHSFAQNGHPPSVVAFSRNGKWAVSGGGSGDDTLQLWDLGDSAKTSCTTWEGADQRGVGAVTFLGDRRIVSAGLDGTLAIWSPTELAPLMATDPKNPRRFKASTGWVLALDVSLDDKWAATGGWTDEPTIKVWDLANEQPRGREKPKVTLAGHERGVRSVHFLEQAREILSGGLDGKLRLWDVATGEEILAVEGPGGLISDVAVSSEDGRRVLCADESGGLALYELKREG